jgi:hypothetical protein
MEKFRKEEKRSDYIMFPRILWRFFPFLAISLLSYVPPKPGRIADTGCLCVDPSTYILERTAPPTYKSQKPVWTVLKDENPAVHYGSATSRWWSWLWNTRLSHPTEDVYVAANDISSAFKWVHYNPNSALAFATFFAHYLVVPVGMIFGARSSPAWFMAFGELRAHLAATFDFGLARTHIASKVVLRPSASQSEITLFGQATADSLNQGRTAICGPNRLDVHTSFVDDTANAGTATQIQRSINASILAAFVTFGFPREQHQPDPINGSKWTSDISHILRFLGYI